MATLTEQMASFKQGKTAALRKHNDRHGVSNSTSSPSLPALNGSRSSSDGGRTSPMGTQLAVISTSTSFDGTTSSRSITASLVEENRDRSQRISKLRISQREQIGLEHRRQKRRDFQKRSKWRQSMIAENKKTAQKSPFAVDLVAETERIDEEVAIRLRFEERLLLEERRRKDKVIVEVIRSAMTQEDEVQKLREQKRALVIEEKRLKALRDVERSNANMARKADLLAETVKQRRIASELSAEKRNKVLQRVEDKRNRKAEALKRRHGISQRRSDLMPVVR